MEKKIKEKTKLWDYIIRCPQCGSKDIVIDIDGLSCEECGMETKED